MAEHYQQEVTKADVGPDGQKTKLKDAFLLRPPNNQVLLMKSIFNRRQPTIYFPYPACLKMQRPVDVSRLDKTT